MLVYLETSRTGAVGMRCEFSQNRIRTVHRLDVPRQGQHIAPKAVRMKQGLEASAPWRCERAFELRQPTFRNGRDGVCSGEHRGLSRLASADELVWTETRVRTH